MLSWNALSVPKDPDDPKLNYSLTQKAETFMEQQVQNGKPFLLQISHFADHQKYQARQATVTKYETTYAANKMEYHNDSLWAAKSTIW